MRGRSRLAEAAIAGVAGIVAGVPIALLSTWAIYPLAAWDAGALAYIASVWIRVWRLSPSETARLAGQEDPTHVTTDLLILCAAVVSLVAVGFILGRAANSSGSTQVALAALGVASVALSWLLVHTIYTLRYARLYYEDPPGGVDFLEDAPPDYGDFAYLAFTLGMTFQVSDTSLKSKPFRRTALRHGLLSFVFVTGIIASSVNLVANLGGGGH